MSLTVNGADPYTITIPEENPDNPNVERAKFLERIKTLMTTANTNESDYLSLISLFSLKETAIAVENHGNLRKLQNGSYVLGNLNIPVPEDLVKTYIQRLKLGIGVEALERFWKLLVLNPDKHVREGLFKFASTYKFPITEDGMFIAYKSVAWGSDKYRSYAVAINSIMARNLTQGYGKSHLDSPQHVVSWDDYNSFEILSEQEMTNSLTQDKVEILEDQTIAEAYKSAFESQSIDARSEWEPVDLQVLTLEKVKELEDANLLKTENGVTYRRPEVPEPVVCQIQTLEEAFNNLETLTSIDGYEYTDHHTNTTKIRIGEAVSMPREDCDNDPKQSCSEGLHLGAPSYVGTFGHPERFVLACLCNPMNVVAVPYQDKLRCCEYYPFGLVKMKGGKILEVDHNEEIITNYIVENPEKIEEQIQALFESEGSSSSHITREAAEAIAVEFKTRRINVNDLQGK